MLTPWHPAPEMKLWLISAFISCDVSPSLALSQVQAIHGVGGAATHGILGVGCRPLLPLSLAQYLGCSKHRRIRACSLELLSDLMGPTALWLS